MLTSIVFWGAPWVTGLALAAVTGVVWHQSRARAQSRWQAALDAYAQRQIAKDRHRNAQKRLQALYGDLRISASTRDHMTA
jgi:hypothetical protein